MTSPGWAWVKEMYTQAGKFRGKKLVADKLIDAVAARLDIDERALAACRAPTQRASVPLVSADRAAAACRATMASSTLLWIDAARHAGVPHANAAVVIGGRIYDGLADQTMIHALVEAELAPGILGSLPRWHTGK